MATGNLDSLKAAQSLRDKLDAFIAGTAEASGMKSILEFAAQHVPVAEKDHTSCKQIQTTCGHSCPQHKEVMSPALWGALPKDLLQIVFARLPLADISRLRCLSKEWKTSIETAHSEFNQVCEAINSRNSFALITTDGDQHGIFWVRVFDMNANRWHEFEFESGDKYCVALVAHDGGLVCLLSLPFESRFSDGSSKPVILTVWNLLTREKHRLPTLVHLDGSTSTMVHLVVDSQTKHYKVGVAKHSRPFSGVQEGAHIYDSESQQWSEVKKFPRVIFGMSYSWPRWGMDAEMADVHPCRYDFAEARLHKLNRKVEPWGEDDIVKDFAFLQDRLFLLHECEIEPDTPTYRISEYRADVNPGSDHQTGTNWLFERTHSCGPFENPPVSQTDYFFDLFAYKGFLLVCVQNKEPEDSPFHHQRLWLYDLSTCKWRDLPNLVKHKEVSGDPDIVYHESILCELRPWHMLR
ncbi:hypothetical protein KC19_4G019000 [Ceratodon purpureus]|uniref:F-box domain-containing protein n=1 Tax=Ceratodon purpureus TaxID=3225 RepID=A0A8T0I5U9_CERPU|nr:hypothetical protein KC19_4G019000 [Ceratodon purpureus]